jgi:polar amino acid transport system substrate-binding protein
MRARKMSTAIFTAAFALTLLAPHPGAARVQNATVNIAADEEKRGGCLAEVTRAAFKRVGYPTEIHFVPWARALQGTIVGHYEVLLAPYYKEERTGHLSYTAPIGKVEVYFWKKRERAIPYAKLDDMKPYRIGFIRASSVSEEFDKAMETYLRMSYVRTPEMNIRHLLTGRIDVFVEKKQQVEFLLRNKFPGQARHIVALGQPLKVGEFFNAASKASPRHDTLLEDFNRGLKMIKADGTEKTIRARHAGQ